VQEELQVQGEQQQELEEAEEVLVLGHNYSPAFE